MRFACARHGNVVLGGKLASKSIPPASWRACRQSSSTSSRHPPRLEPTPQKSRRRCSLANPGSRRTNHGSAGVRREGPSRYLSHSRAHFAHNFTTLVTTRVSPVSLSPKRHVLRAVSACLGHSPSCGGCDGSSGKNTIDSHCAISVRIWQAFYQIYCRADSQRGSLLVILTRGKMACRDVDSTVFAGALLPSAIPSPTVLES